MRGAYVGGLLDLPGLSGNDERRAVFRQSMAELARACTEDGPGPLEGLHPEAVLSGVKVALADGLFNRLDWLAPPAAGAALYEVASAIPLGAEQRELGRHVLSSMLGGSAETFASIATRMALGNGKGLGSQGARARVSLLVELPIAAGVADGPLALALVARRQLVRDFVIRPSTESLPSRRLAARLFERAAREAARRAQQGDSHPLRAFVADGVNAAFERLLFDREPLVWRHVAIARGLLAPWVTGHNDAVAGGLDTKLSPTEWRRAATSIAAMTAVSPEEAQRLTRQLFGAAGVFERDRGAASAFVWGLGRAAEAEPDAAGEALADVVERAPMEVAEAVAELGTEYGAAAAFERPITRLLAHLRTAPAAQGGDDGQAVLLREVMTDIERIPRRRVSLSDAEPVAQDGPLRVQVQRALDAFAAEGARAAYGMAKEALSSMSGAIDTLLAVAEEETSDDQAGALARRTALSVLRDVDASLLERGTLLELLRLGPVAGDVRGHEDAVDAARETIAEWILARDAEVPAAKVDAHRTLRMRRLRALLHLVDSDVGDEDPARAAKLRRRFSRVAAVLLGRLEKGVPPSLRRATSAALARALDALVRAQALDPADALLQVARVIVDPAEYQVLAEASMDPELRHAFSRYAAFVGAWSDPGLGGQDRVRAMLEAFEAWTEDLFVDPSSRAEAVRTMMVRIHQALRVVAETPSLVGLCSEGETEPDVLASMESSLLSLGQLTVGSRARLMADPVRTVPAHAGASIAIATSRVLSGAEPELDERVFDASVAELVREVPRAVAVVVRECLARLPGLPRRAAEMSGAVRVSEQLPPWLPARRTLGGFYVIRALGSGAVGSVFVVCRVEERHDNQAEHFALKVPDYSGGAARSVSETEFLQMFRQEASALMSLPAHKNLANFVTFDTAARPKPILVMELVEGTTLEHVIESRAMTTARGLQVLDDVLAGLEAMHAVDVGHLDLKPSNVMLRGGHEAVLVDFGLAGRHIRPGCATGPYGAPEVWGAEVPGAKPTPAKADVYAFGCLAFEALTGQTLFMADNELAQISMHLAHDGFPDKLRGLAARPELQPLAELLFSTLRRDPAKRPVAATLRAELRKLGPSLAQARWPLGA